MTERQRTDGLDLPGGPSTSFWSRFRPAAPESSDWFGRFTEQFARAMGTPAFLVCMTVFIIVWLVWNTLAPEPLRFDSADLGFIALTLALSLEASYAAPLLLLAQNRQDDRDRVQIEQDRQRAERNLADTEYLAREVAALRLAVKDLASERFVRDELSKTVEELATAIDDIRSRLPERPTVAERGETRSE